MIKREAQFGQLIRHYLAKYPIASAALELKQTTTDRLSFSDVQEHQLDALLAAKHTHLLYKIPDDSRGIKPFDMVMLNHVDAFVVIRYPKEFVFIDIDKFIQEKEWSMEKSLTSKRASEIAEIHIGL